MAKFGTWQHCYTSSFCIFDIFGQNIFFSRSKLLLLLLKRSEFCLLLLPIGNANARVLNMNNAAEMAFYAIDAIHKFQKVYKKIK
jgi:hypothetical protein